MKEAELKTVTFDLVSPEIHVFEASATKIIFDGYLKLMESTKQENRELAKVSDGTKADIKDIETQIKQLTDKQWIQFIRSFFSTLPTFSISTTAIGDALKSIREVFKNIKWEGSYLQKGLNGTSVCIH